MIRTTGQRILRHAQSPYGPMGAPQGNAGGMPTPVGPGDLIFDWNPAVNPFGCQVSGISFTHSGTPAYRYTGGRVGMLLGASYGYLTGDGSPVTDLSDGAVSVYMVVNQIANVATDYPFSMDDSSKSADYDGVISIGFNNSSNAVALAGVPTSSVHYDLAAGVVDDTVMVISGHFTSDGTTRTARVDGATDGDNASGAGTIQPSGMDRITIGREAVLATPTASANDYVFYRILIYRAAYNADVIA